MCVIHLKWIRCVCEIETVCNVAVTFFFATFDQTKAAQLKIDNGKNDTEKEERGCVRACVCKGKSPTAYICVTTAVKYTGISGDVFSLKTFECPFIDYVMMVQSHLKWHLKYQKVIYRFRKVIVYMCGWYLFCTILVLCTHWHWNVIEENTWMNEINVN